MTGIVLVVLLGAGGGAVRVPYVALGPGPTFNTLAQVDGSEVVDIQGTQTYPTAGNLNMTTVSVSDGITLFGAVGLWVSGRYALVPRETVYPPDKPEEQVKQENLQQFAESEDSAEVAALHYLKFPFSVRVAQVTGGSPSDGLLMAGDRLTTVNGTGVATAGDVMTALAETRPGDGVAIGFTRDGQKGSTRVVLGVRPDDEPRGYLGVTTADAPNVPFTVDFSLSEVGGPSAGLMFSLAVVDKLTPGELNAGSFVAGTGTIDNDGAVGAIGGIPFKMVAAREAGAQTFLVPADNCAEALSNAPDGLRLVKVETLSGAVDALESLGAGSDAPSC